MSSRKAKSDKGRKAKSDKLKQNMANAGLLLGLAAAILPASAVMNSTRDVVGDMIKMGTRRAALDEIRAARSAGAVMRVRQRARRQRATPPTPYQLSMRDQNLDRAQFASDQGRRGEQLSVPVAPSSVVPSPYMTVDYASDDEGPPPLEIDPHYLYAE